MRPLIVNTFLTLDGVMQAPGGPEEDPSESFTHGGWSVHYWDEAMNQKMDESMGPHYAFDLLLGRKTYEIFAGFWPLNPDQPGAAELNAATKFVASRTLGKVDWENSYLLEGDLADAVKELKEQDGPPIHVHGSAELIQSLLANDLVDELRLMIFPLVLGSGKRLFGEGTIPASFEVTDSRTATTGVLLVNYKRAGDVEYGTFEPEPS